MGILPNPLTLLSVVSAAVVVLLTPMVIYSARPSAIVSPKSQVETTAEEPSELAVENNESSALVVQFRVVKCSI